MPAEAPTDAELTDLADETRRINEQYRTTARRIGDLELDVIQLKDVQGDVVRGLGKVREEQHAHHSETRALLKQLVERLPDPAAPSPDTLHRATLLGAVLAGGAAAWKALTTLLKGD